MSRPPARAPRRPWTTLTAPRRDLPIPPEGGCDPGKPRDARNWPLRCGQLALASTQAALPSGVAGALLGGRWTSQADRIPVNHSGAAIWPPPARSIGSGQPALPSGRFVHRRPGRGRSRRGVDGRRCREQRRGWRAPDLRRFRPPWRPRPCCCCCPPALPRGPDLGLSEGRRRRRPGRARLFEPAATLRQLSRGALSVAGTGVEVRCAIGAAAN
jgi:hypothetical protein